MASSALAAVEEEEVEEDGSALFPLDETEEEESLPGVLEPLTLLTLFNLACAMSISSAPLLGMKRHKLLFEEEEIPLTSEVKDEVEEPSLLGVLGAEGGLLEREASCLRSQRGRRLERKEEGFASVKLEEIRFS